MEKGLRRSVLVISERFRPEKFLVNDLVDEWVGRGYGVRVLTQVPSYPHDRLFPGYPNEASSRDEGGARITRFKTVLGYRRSVARKALNYLAFMARACLRALREARDVDAVFVYHTGPLTQALPIVPIKIFLGKRTTIWTQDVWPDTVFAYGFPDRGPFAVLLKAFVRLVYRFADEVVVSSPGFVERLAPYLREGAVARFVPQWVPAEFERAERHGLDFEAPGTRFIFTGNIGSMQNLENVIRAFARLAPDSACLYIIGEGSLRQQLENLARETGAGNVRFLGSVEQSKVKACIQACDFSLLSLTGNPVVGLTIPAKFQAYLAAGKPIVAIASGEVRRIVEEESLGVTADTDDLDDIQAAFVRAASASAGERAAWSANAAKLLAGEYAARNSLEALTKTTFEQGELPYGA